MEEFKGGEEEGKVLGIVWTSFVLKSRRTGSMCQSLQIKAKSR